MTFAQRQRIKELFDAAFELAPAAQARLLAEARAADPAVSAEVEALLRQHRDAPEFLEDQPVNELLDWPDEPALTGLHPGREIGPYRLVRELGRGGMGVVYLAERTDGVHQQPVALKFVWSGEGPDVARRFLDERVILARLNHPNIARMLDGGTTAEGWHYLVMEYVEGQSLTAYCRERKLTIPARLELFRTVCAAVQYAHQHLVIHRDLKPSNILVTSAGTAKLLDFGIAKLLDPGLAEGEPSTLTRGGLLPLTPLYASPEQVRNQPITTASDVYSLGVLLYELLTGCKPYRTESTFPPDQLRAVLEEEPERPSLRVAERMKDEGGRMKENPVSIHPSSLILHPSSLRGDLDNIVLKALQKEVAQRYATVDQLSDDLLRHLNGEPVTARPATWRYRAGKYVRRNRTFVTLASLLALTLLTVALVTAWQLHASQAREHEQRYQLYAAAMQRAGQVWAEGNLLQMDVLLEAHRPGTRSDEWRGLEWFALWKLLHRERLVLPHRKWVHSALYTPDGKTIVTTDWDGRIMLWDALNGQSLGTLATQPEGVLRMVVSSDGKRLVTAHADGWVRIWDIAGKRAITVLPPLVINNQAHLALSPDGKRVAIHHNFQPFQVWEIETAQLVETYTLPTNFEIPVHGPMRYLPDGKLVCLVRRGRHWELWDLAARRSLVRLDPQSGNPLALSTVYPLGHTFSPDGQRYYLSTEDRLVRAWDTKSGKLLHVFSGHQSVPKTPAISSDGKLLATTGDDKTMRLWDTTTSQLLALTINESQVDEPVFSPDNRSLAAICYLANRVKVWDVQELLASTPPLVFDQVQTLALAPDGKTIVAIPVAQNAHTQVSEAKRRGERKRASSEHLSVPALHDVQTGQRIISYETANHRYAGCVDFSADGRLVSMCRMPRDAPPDGWPPLVEIRETVSGKLVTTLNEEAGVMAVRFSPDGKTLAIAGNGKAVRLWDTSTWRERLSWLNETNKNESIDFAPDSRQLALGSWDNLITVWDVASGKLLQTLRGHQAPVWQVEYSPDGKLLASASLDFTVKLWDTATGRELRTLTGHANSVYTVAFSPDGRRLVTGSDDQTVRLWDVATGEPLTTLHGHTGPVWRVAFTPDGQTLLSSSAKETRVWRAATMAEVQARYSR